MTKKSSTSTREVFSASLDSGLLHKLRLYCNLTKQSYSSVMEIALREYLNEGRMDELLDLMSSMTKLIESGEKAQ